MAKIELSAEGGVIELIEPDAALIERATKNFRWTVGILAVRNMLIDVRQARFADMWTKGKRGNPNHPQDIALEATRDAFFSRIVGGVALDLGCGPEESRQDFQELVAKYGPRAYIGVDHVIAPHRDGTAIEELGFVMPQSPEQGDAIPGALIEGDLLATLAHLPDASMRAVFANGLDGHMVEPGSKYEQDVMSEVTRVVEPDGMVLGYTKAGGILSVLSRRGDFQTEYSPLYEGAGEGKGFYYLKKPD
jgi:hypothetical protein